MGMLSYRFDWLFLFKKGQQTIRTDHKVFLKLYDIVMHRRGSCERPLSYP